MGFGSTETGRPEERPRPEVVASMAIEYMLRDYRVRPGKMDDWLEEWSNKVYPLRLKFGFKVAGAWKIGEDRFVWILGLEVEGDFGKSGGHGGWDGERRVSLLLLQDQVTFNQAVSRAWAARPVSAKRGSLPAFA